MTDLKRAGAQVSLLDHGRWVEIERAIDLTCKDGHEIWECGAYRGGTVLYMKGHLADSPRVIRAFDTFSGLPTSGANDIHAVGDIAADYDEVIARLGGLSNVHVYKGTMPETFAGLEESIISVAHIDVDQYESVRDCLAWLYPRVHSGGWIILDDYNCSNCPGARLATDEFLADKPEKLLFEGDANPQARFQKL